MSARRWTWWAAFLVAALGTSACSDVRDEAVPDGSSAERRVRECTPGPASSGPNGDSAWGTSAELLASTHTEVFSGVRWDGGAQQIVFGTVDPDAAESLIAAHMQPEAPYRLEQVPRNGAQLRQLIARAMSIDAVFSAGPRSWDATVELGVDVGQPEAIADIIEVFAGDLDAICITLSEPPQALLPTVAATTIGADRTAPPTSTAAEVQPLVRPVVAASYCTTVSAGEGSVQDPTFFARRSAFPVPRQVYADPSGDLSHPYAVVQRYLDGQVTNRGGMPVTDINGHESTVIVNPFGGGDVRWLLPDGSEVHVRSRGLDEAQVTQLARALVPRPLDAPVAAFDPSGPLPAGIALVAETAGPISGSGAGSICQLDSGARIVVDVIRGDPLYAYLVGLDAPHPPLLTRRGDAVIIVLGTRHGEPDPLTILADVRNATTEEWNRLVATGTLGPDFHG